MSNSIHKGGMNRRIAISSFIAVAMVLLVFGAIQPVSAWTRIAPIYINNTAGNALAYYQVNLTVLYDSDMNTNFSDLRVVRVVNETYEFLPYWIENKSDGQWCKLWFNATYIPANSWCNDTYYLLYGNASASDASDGDSVFEFFDDFETDTFPDTEGDVAISNDSGKYEAWPAVAKSSDGTLYVVYRTCDSNTHGFDSTGRIVIRKSTDGGQTWSSEIVVADEANIDDRNPNIIIFDNNGTETILVVYNTYDSSGNFYAYCRKSTDGGQTWGNKIALSSGNMRATRGRPILLSNGKLLVPIYSEEAGSNGNYVVESSDGGDSWTEYTVSNGDGNEFSIIEVKTNGSFQGKVYALIRNETSPYVYKKTESTDYGHTWSSLSDENDFQNPYKTPIDLIRASDDDILAAYTTTGDELVIYKSTDECANWNYIKTVVSTQSVSYYPSLEFVDSSKLIVVWCTNADTSDVYANFEDYPLVPNKWVVAAGSKPSISNSIMTINSPTQRIHSTDYWNGYNSSLVFEMKIKHVNTRTIGFSKTKADGDTDWENWIILDDYHDNFRVEYNDDNWNGGVNLTENTWIRFKVIWTNSDVYGYEDSTLLGHKTPSDGNGIPDWDAWVYFYIYSDDTNPSIEVDWVFIRKYADPEPTALLGEEQNVGSECTAPTISSLTNSTPTTNSVTITWTTNQSADNRVKYSKNSDLSNPLWSSWDNDTTSVSITLTGLEANTTYYYQAWSYNGTNSSCYTVEPSSQPYRSFTTQSSGSGAYNITLQPGWNLIGWTDPTPKSAHSVGLEIGPNCTYIVERNRTTGLYVSHNMNGPEDENNFMLERGWGYYVRVSAETKWNRSA